jgi:transposase InsO family protein
MTYSWANLGKFSGCSLKTGKIVEDRGKIWVVRDISAQAEQRHKWLVFYWEHNNNARLTCRHFGISTKTFYKAKKRFSEQGFKGLNDLPKRPHNFRKSNIPLPVISAVVKIRENHPTWSKYKIGACLRRQEINLSASSVGRILKAKNKIDENVSRKKKRTYKRSQKRVRIDGEVFVLKYPGDLIQVDVKYVYYPWGEKIYQFTAIDCVTRLRILRLYSSKTALTSKNFLQEIIRFMPFKIKRVQSDNGSEFLGDFRVQCASENIKHFFSYPNSPEQNAFVEASHSTDEREFYALTELPETVAGVRLLLQKWQDCYNYERPHQSLNYLTPWDYYKNICSTN